MSASPEERRLKASLAAHSRWARTTDRTAATAAAREGLLLKFERQVDPLGELLPAERSRRAKNAAKAHMQRMSLKASQAAARRREAREA